MSQYVAVLVGVGTQKQRSVRVLWGNRLEPREQELH